LEGKRRLRNQVTGRARLVTPRVLPKNKSQRAQTVGVSMKTANAEPPHPRIKRMILEAIYERNDELDRFSIV
jgi:hypothetical protein